MYACMHAWLSVCLPACLSVWSLDRDSSVCSMPRLALYCLASDTVA